jgi:hypothetical protein
MQYQGEVDEIRIKNRKIKNATQSQKSKVFMLVHVLRQTFRLSPVIMQTDRFLLFHLVRAVEHPRVHMS